MISTTTFLSEDADMQGFDPVKAYHELTEAGNDWADKKSAFQALDDQTKSVLSQAKIEAAANSDAKAETIARTMFAYREHLEDLAQARHAFLLAQVRYDSLKTLAEMRRTEAATRRVEMQHISGI